jgi:glycosyltransferase involved in cell wall biosynthesis
VKELQQSGAAATHSATVVVTGYNQEAFIRDAIRGAFAQDQDHLEIILSDDCSSDRTYAIMQAEAANYRGGHTVILNKNPHNFGIVYHVNRIFEMASSDFVVFCHGDDISAPHRVRRVLQVFAEQKPLLIHSLADVMGSVKKPEDEFYRSASFFISTEPMQVATSGALYLGATSAFHKDIMRIFGPICRKNTFEDLTLGFRAALEGRVALINEPLIQYRPDVGTSARIKPTSIADAIAKRRDQLKLRIATLEQRYEDVAKSSHRDSIAIRQKISDDLFDKKLRFSFFDRAAIERSLWIKFPLRTLNCLRSEMNRLLRKR